MPSDCCRIVALYQGTFGVRSVKGKGSTFYFTLPVKLESK